MPRIFLRLLAIASAVLSFGLCGATAQQPSAVGLWEQVDEVSGKPEGWFRISEKNGVYEGVLVKGFPKPGEDPASWKCDKCEGAEKNAPVVGLALIKNMKRNGLNYENGTIMDPRDGNVYHALMKVSPDGQKLDVRGYLGIALFGRTQTWNRLPDSAMDPTPPTRQTAQPKRTGPAPARAASPSAQK